jgi:hypothetical protein
MIDALARLAPTHYYDILTRVESRLRGRARAGIAKEPVAAEQG